MQEGTVHGIHELQICNLSDCYNNLLSDVCGYTQTEMDDVLACTEIFPLFIDELKSGFVKYLKLPRKSPAISVLYFHVRGTIK